jgi:hypothetical protein
VWNFLPLFLTSSKIQQSNTGFQLVAASTSKMLVTMQQSTQHNFAQG